MGLVRGWIISHALYLLLVMGALVSYLWLMYFRKRLAMSGLAAFCLAFLHAFLGLLVLKTFAFLENRPGGMSLISGIFFVPLLYIACAKLAKRNTADMADALTVCAPITMIFAKVNCIVGGCCYGIPFFGSETLRWPTRGMEIVFNILCAIWLGRRVLQNKTHGTAYPLYMISYGMYRLVVEFVWDKPHLWGPFHRAHVLALLCVMVGAAAYAVITRKIPLRESKETRKT